MQEPTPLQKFAERMAGGAEERELEARIPELAASSSLEDACRLLRKHCPGKDVLIRRFAEAAEAARQARQAGWQHDASKLRLRLQYQRTGTAAARLPSEILRLLLETFQAAGLQPALGLEKRPRPMLHLGHPLPQGTEGLQEYVEVVLQGPTIDPDPVPGLNAVAPEGLTFMSCEVLPDYATPVLDLCQRAEWRWRCPETLRTGAAERIRAFLAADSFQIEKTGKEGGQKQVKKVEVRPLVLAMQWDGDALRFETRLEPGQALHPAKLLGGILGVEPARITGLVRTRIDLAEDPRLDQAERFEPKLKNMFEDAVLLKAGPNLRLIDEDEDEPLQLG